MNKYATIDPTKLASNMVLTQLDPIDLGGVNYYGWEIQFTKKFDTGKKDKQTKQEMYGQKIDDSKAPIFDGVTALVKAGKLNDPTIARLMVSNARLMASVEETSSTVADLTKQVAMLKLQVAKGGNK